MTFIVNTAWKHDSPIDWEKMQNDLNEVMSKSVSGCSVQWFEIDEHTHGSVATFPNKEAYDEMTNLRNNHRKEATDSGIKMIYEVIGHLKAEGKVKSSESTSHLVRTLRDLSISCFFPKA